MKLRPNVMGEQNKSKLKFSNSSSSNQQSPRLVHCGEAQGACPGFLCASQQHHFLITLRTEKQRIPFTANKGGHGNTSDPSELTHRDSQNEIDGLPASCSRHTRSEQQQVPPRLQTKGSRFAVNSLPGRKTFSSKETIYLE